MYMGEFVRGKMNVVMYTITIPVEGHCCNRGRYPDSEGGTCGSADGCTPCMWLEIPAMSRVEIG